jgi:nucleosome-remodeling factor subunit BPTF
VLERAELGQAARVGGLRAVSGFHYEAKTAGAAWPYPCPRPLFRKMWQYHLQFANNLSAIGLQLHILWVCLSWEDILV